MSFLDLEIVKYPKPFHTLPTPACLLHAGVGAVAGLLPDCFSLSRSLRSGCGSLVGIARVRSGTRNPESPFKLSNARLLAALLHLTEAILCCSGDRYGRTPCVDPRGVLPSSQLEPHLPQQKLGQNSVGRYPCLCETERPLSSSAVGSAGHWTPFGEILGPES